jgi:hypothetical protein
MAPVLRIRLAAAKRIHRSELTLFFGEEVEGGRGRGGATMEVGGLGAAAVSSALYFCVREGGGNMAGVMCMHAIEDDLE